MVMGLGDQTGERHLRIRARSPTGSVAGAASYVNGLSAQGANRGLPALRSPTKAPASDTSDANTPPDEPQRPPHHHSHTGMSSEARNLRTLGFGLYAQFSAIQWPESYRGVGFVWAAPPHVDRLAADGYVRLDAWFGPDGTSARC